MMGYPIYASREQLIEWAKEFPCSACRGSGKTDKGFYCSACQGCGIDQNSPASYDWRQMNGTPALTIITPTFNKGKYLRDAAHCVFMLTWWDWVWWIILDNANEETKEVAFSIRDDPKMCGKVKIFEETFPEAERFKECRPAAMINKYYPMVETKYLYWFSDDDLLDRSGIERLIGALESHPEWDIAHGRCVITHELKDGSYAVYGELGGRSDIGLGTGIMPLCQIDGGQILQTKRSYDRLGGWQLTTLMAHAAVVDGVYMNKLAEHFRFHYVDTPLLTHRRTKLSVYITPEALGDHR